MTEASKDPKISAPGPVNACDVVSIKSSASNLPNSVTYAAQSTLPRLPIPTLEETMEKFPILVAALQTPAEREETKQKCQEFLQNDGPALQAALQEYYDTNEKEGNLGSYIEEFWNESYLGFDESVVLNLNPYFVLEKGPDAKIATDQLRRAANLTFAAVKFASALKTETLTPDIFRGKPLCMDQFKVLLGSSRQPTKNEADEVHVYSDSSHIVVLCNNQFYYFPVLWPESCNVAVDEADILDILTAIHKHAGSIDPDEATKGAIGVLTSLPRNEWADARTELSKSEANVSALRVIDSALFLIVLDDYEPEHVHAKAANTLHGTSRLEEDAKTGESVQRGSCLNRWYDKLQIIICSDGSAGVNFEHAAIDGHTALRFSSDMYAETIISFAETITQSIYGKDSIPHVIDADIRRAADTCNDLGAPILDVFPRKLVLELHEPTFTSIRYAETALTDHIRSCETHVLEYTGYGKALIVNNSMSPDSLVQMCMLLAYHRLYGKIVCMYEPVLTKSFFHGRTEAMRTTTLQAKRMCEVWESKKSTKSQKLDALKVAIREHGRLVKESASGKGVDRHLYALKCIAQAKGLPIPDFFSSSAWNKLTYTIISTSNCGNPALRLFGFGPVVNDGFGIGYIIKDCGVSYAVASKHRQTVRYCQTLERVMNDIKDLLKPLSVIEVHRPSLRNVKRVTSGQSSGFDDIFGENSAKPVLPAHGSSYFSSIRVGGPSIDLLDIPEIRLDVDLDGKAYNAVKTEQHGDYDDKNSSIARSE